MELLYSYSVKGGVLKNDEPPLHLERKQEISKTAKHRVKSLTVHSCKLSINVKCF